jgi:hypothetical protein
MESTQQSMQATQSNTMDAVHGLAAEFKTTSGDTQKLFHQMLDLLQVRLSEAGPSNGQTTVNGNNNIYIYIFFCHIDDLYT